MSLSTQLFGIVFSMVMFTCVLFILFGQTTVRKLRKNTQAKDALGSEFISGWDIINVAQALAFPKSWSSKLEQGKLSFLYANAQVVRSNTTKFDRVLGALFYWMLVITGFLLALLGFLDFIGIFG